MLFNHAVVCGAQVVTDLDGNFIVQIGSTGEEGLRDGSFDDATFNRPQVRKESVLQACYTHSAESADTDLFYESASFLRFTILFHIFNVCI